MLLYRDISFRIGEQIMISHHIHLRGKDGWTNNAEYNLCLTEDPRKVELMILMFKTSTSEYFEVIPGSDFEAFKRVLYRCDWELLRDIDDKENGGMINYLVDSMIDEKDVNVAFLNKLHPWMFSAFQDKTPPRIMGGVPEVLSPFLLDTKIDDPLLRSRTFTYKVSAEYPLDMGLVEKYLFFNEYRIDVVDKRYKFTRRAEKHSWKPCYGKFRDGKSNKYVKMTGCDDLVEYKIFICVDSCHDYKKNNLERLLYGVGHITVMDTGVGYKLIDIRRKF